MRVVVSIGGSVLAPDLGAERVTAYADAVGELVGDGDEVGVVVGGGGVAREYIETGRALGADEIRLDELGIGVTRLNARLLLAALGDAAAPSPAESYETAGEAMRRGDVAVMGGVTPGQTTDAVAAALAEFAGADLLVFATSVDGVYSADPAREDDAERFERLTAAELLDVIADIEMRAGSAAPVDPLAARLIQRSGTRAIVLEGTDPSSVVRAVRAGEHAGTDVVPETAPDRLPDWG